MDFLTQACNQQFVPLLSIEILRTGGDGEEVPIYQTLGSVLSLQKLALGLQCTVYRDSDGPNDPVLMLGPFGDEKEQEDMRAATPGVFINAAIDEALHTQNLEK